MLLLNHKDRCAQCSIPCGSCDELNSNLGSGMQTADSRGIGGAYHDGSI